MDIGDKVVVDTKDGTKKLEIALKFDCEQTMRTYFGCVDKEKIENNEQDIYFFYYDTNYYTGELFEVETEEEKELIKEVLESIKKHKG